MTTSTAPPSRTHSPHRKQISGDIPLRGFKSNSSPVLCSAHRYIDHRQPKYRSIPTHKVGTGLNQGTSSASPIPQSTSSSAPNSRSSTPYCSEPPTPLSTGSDSSFQIRKRKPSSLFKNFHFSVSSSRQRSASHTPRRDSLGPQSRTNTSASSTSSENGDLPSPPLSPKSTAMPRLGWANDSKRRRRSRGYSATSVSRHGDDIVDNMGFPFGKVLPSSSSRGRDAASVTHPTPPRPTRPTDPFSVHPGTPVDFSTPEEPSFPYKRHSATSNEKEKDDEYHAYLSSEVRDRGKSLPGWGRV